MTGALTSPRLLVDLLVHNPAPHTLLHTRMANCLLNLYSVLRGTFFLLLELEADLCKLLVTEIREFLYFQISRNLLELLTSLSEHCRLPEVHELQYELHLEVLNPPKEYDWMYLMMAGENASKDWTARTEDSLVSSELDVVVTDQGDIRELVLGIEIPKHPSKVFRVGGP